MEQANDLSVEEDMRRSLCAIRLVCEDFVDEMLCNEGLDLKRQVIYNIDYLGDRNPVKPEEVELARIKNRAKMWDRACELSDEGKMLKSLEEEVFQLKKQITVLKKKKSD